MINQWKLETEKTENWIPPVREANHFKSLANIHKISVESSKSLPQSIHPELVKFLCMGAGYCITQQWGRILQILSSWFHTPPEASIIIPYNPYWCIKKSCTPSKYPPPLHSTCVMTTLCNTMKKIMDLFLTSFLVLLWVIIVLLFIYMRYNKNDFCLCLLF